MPTPIPEWDMARRIVKFVGSRQIAGKPTTVRQLSRAMGIGRERIRTVLVEKKVDFAVIERSDSAHEDWFVLQHVSPNLALDAGVSVPDLTRTCEEFMKGTPVERKIKKKRLNKKQLEKLKIKNFWEQRMHENTE